MKTQLGNNSTANLLDSLLQQGAKQVKGSAQAGSSSRAGSQPGIGFDRLMASAPKAPALKPSTPRTLLDRNHHDDIAFDRPSQKSESSKSRFEAKTDAPVERKPKEASPSRSDDSPAATEQRTERKSSRAPERRDDRAADMRSSDRRAERSDSGRNDSKVESKSYANTSEKMESAGENANTTRLTDSSAQPSRSLESENVAASSAEERKALDPLLKSALTVIKGVMAEQGEAPHSNPVMALLSGRLEQLEPKAIPELVTQNGFLNRAFGAENLAAFMDQPTGLGQLLDDMGVDEQILQEATLRGVDLAQPITPFQLMDGLGLDAHRARNELSLLKQSLQMDAGLSPYMLRAAKLRAQSGIHAPQTNAMGAPIASGIAAQAQTQEQTTNPVQEGEATQAAPAPQPQATPKQNNLNKQAQAKAMAASAAAQTADGHLVSSMAATDSEELTNPELQIHSGLKQAAASGQSTTLTDQSLTNGSVKGNELGSDLQRTLTQALPQQAVSSLEGEAVSKPLGWERLSESDVQQHDPFAAFANRFNSQNTVVTKFTNTANDVAQAALSMDGEAVEEPMRILDDGFVVRETSANGAQLGKSHEAATPMGLLAKQALETFDAEVEATDADPTADWAALNTTADATQVQGQEHPARQAMLAQLAAAQATDSRGQTLDAAPSKAEFDHAMDRLAAEARGIVQTNGGRHAGNQQQGGGFGEQGRPSLDALAGLGTQLQSSKSAEAGKFEVDMAQVQGPAITSEVVKRAQMLVNQGGGHVKIDLGDPGLGKLELSVSVQGDNLELKILAGTEQVRDLLNQNLPKLKDALTGQNLDLKQVEVGLSQEGAFAQDFGNGNQGFQGFERQETDWFRDGIAGSSRSFRSNLTRFTPTANANLPRHNGQIQVRI